MKRDYFPWNNLLSSKFYPKNIELIRVFDF